jgi:hypothetical protein
LGIIIGIVRLGGEISMWNCTMACTTMIMSIITSIMILLIF